MKQALCLLSAALLVSGQGDPPNPPTFPNGQFTDATTTFMPIDTQAQVGSGAYQSMVPSEAATGQLPHHAEITLFPPQRWGRMGWTVDDTPLPGTSATSGELNVDKVEIEFVGASAVPPHAAQDFSPWTPFNQYPRALYNEMNWRFAGFDSGNLLENTAQVTSSPPCLFTTVVAPKGAKVTLYVMDCALWRGWNDPRTDFFAAAPQGVQQVTPPERDGGLGAQTMFDKLVVFLPWPFLAPNAPFPHLMIETQATFFLAQEAVAHQWTKIGPYRVNTPYVIQAPILALYSLQLREFLPGAPNQNIKVNTIADTPIEAITVGLQLGLPLQAGMKIVLTTSVGPVVARRLSQAVPPTNTAPPLAFPLPADNQDNLIWAVPGTEPANTFIAVGSACGVRAGSVNCCGQSTAQILVPQVSQITYPEWFKSIVITLGPPGCVLPINRRISFVIPRPFLGKNPKQTVADPVQSNAPGFWAVQTLVSTSAEAGTHFFQRYGGDIDPIGYRQAILADLTPPSTPPSSFTRYLSQQMAADLPTEARISFRDLAFGGTLSSYVVGLSSFQSITYKPNTLIAGVQPQEATVTITFTKGLTRLVPLQGTNVGGFPIADVNTQVTPYFITIFASWGTIRPNVGSLADPIQLTSSVAACANALQAMTSVTSNVIIRVKEDACISALSADKSTLSFVLPQAFLYPNHPAGFTVKVDARVVPAMHSVRSQADANPGNVPLTLMPYGAVVVADSAMSMGNEVYTTVADCSTLPNQVGPVNDITSLTVASRCTLVTSILGISWISAGFLQCNPGATVQNAQNMITYVKYPESRFDGLHYSGVNLSPPASSYPQNVGLGGTPPIYTVDYGYMFSYPMLAVIVSYPPSAANLKALGVAPVVPVGYSLAILVRITRITTACSTSTEYNPWLFCAVVTAPVVNPLYFPATNPNPAGVSVESLTYGRWYSKAATVACIGIVGDGAVAAWYPLGVSPGDDDASDGAWYAFFALFALPLLLLLCCLCALLYFLKLRKPKSCCPAVPQYPVQEMYWVNSQSVPAVSAPGLYAPAASPMYLA